MTSLVSIRELGKTFRSRGGALVEAIGNISLDIDEGEFVSVVGPSGAGKTTLLNILMGLLASSHGEVRYRGKRVDGPSREIGVVFQDPVLFPWRTVLGNVLLPSEIVGIPAAEARDRAQTLLELVDLTGFSEKLPRELSGGMQQRVAIARALMHDPTLLLMDEPFGALDAMTREYMNLELLRIWQQTSKTVLLITHSIAEAIFLSDRVVVLGPRPSSVVAIVNVEIERPRTLEMMAGETFQRLVEETRCLLEKSWSAPMRSQTKSQASWG